MNELKTEPEVITGSSDNKGKKKTVPKKTPARRKQAPKVKQPKSLTSSPETPKEILPELDPPRPTLTLVGLVPTPAGLEPMTEEAPTNGTSTTEPEQAPALKSLPAYAQDPIFSNVAPLIMPENMEHQINPTPNPHADVIFGIPGYVGLWRPVAPGGMIKRDEVLASVFELFIKHTLAHLKDPAHVAVALKPFLLLKTRDAIRVIQRSISIQGRVKLTSSSTIGGIDGHWGGKTLGAFKVAINSEFGEQLERIIDHEIYFCIRSASDTDPQTYGNTLKYIVK